MLYVWHHVVCMIWLQIFNRLQVCKALAEEVWIRLHKNMHHSPQSHSKPEIEKVIIMKTNLKHHSLNWEIASFGINWCVLCYIWNQSRSQHLAIFSSSIQHDVVLILHKEINSAVHLFLSSVSINCHSSWDALHCQSVLEQSSFYVTSVVTLLIFSKSAFSSL